MIQVKPKIIIIVGSTGSGKSALAVEIAKKFNGEIISADSRQVYRKLNIGTAKITKKEMTGVPHHLIDIADIESTYTVVNFKEDATAAISEIVKRGNTPIVTGGTFFYIDILLQRISAPAVPPDQALRDKLESQETHVLYESLMKIDPRRAKTIDKHNKRRLVRALEIAQTLGSIPPLSSQECPYDVLMLGLQVQREELRENFRKRAEKWLADGFVNEVQSLLNEGVSEARLSEMGFEYQLGMQLAKGSLTQVQFIETFVQKNWQYAKRQLTWLKRDKTIHWVFLSEKQELDLTITQFLLH